MKYALSFLVIHIFFTLSMFLLANEKMNLKNWKLYVSFITTWILLILNLEFSMPSLRVIFNIVIYILLAKLLFKKNFKESILLGMLITVLGIFVEFIYGILALPLLSQNLSIQEDVITALINNFIIGVILLIFCHIKSIKNLYNIILATTKKIEEREIIVFSLFIVIIFNFICWISYFVFKDLLDTYYLTFISSSLSIFLTLIVFFYFKVNNKYLTIYEKYNISLDSIREFELMIENYRINTHENENELKTIRNMTKNKKVIGYIDALLGGNMNDDEKLLFDVHKIPSGGLRGIIYSKLLTIKEKNISAELVVDKKISTNFVNLLDDYTLTDICRILGVLIDNAIENSFSLENSYIIIELYEEDSCIVISITNNYVGFVDIECMNNPGVSTKGANHGYGLALVQKLLKKNKKIQHNSEFFEDNFMQKIKIKV